MLTTFNKILITIIILFLMFTFYSCWEKNKYEETIVNLQNQINNLKLDIDRETQNTAGAIDFANQKVDSIKRLSMMVNNLQNDIRIKNELLNSSEKRYAYIFTQYSLMYDSVNILNQQIFETSENLKALFSGDTSKVFVVFDKDSTIEIPFKGKQRKISYSGKTVYVKATKNAYYTLKINIEPVNVKSLIYLDKNDKICNEIKTDGVLIGLVETIIDSAIYNKIKTNNITIVPNKTFYDNLQLGINATMDYNNENKFVFNPSIELCYNTNNNWELILGRDMTNWYFSIGYCTSISDLFKTFKVK